MVRPSPAFRLSPLLSFSLSAPCVFTPSRKIERACGSRRVPPPPAPAPLAFAVVARVSSTRADNLTAVRPFFQRGGEADSCVYSGNHISVVKAAPPTPPLPGAAPHQPGEPPRHFGSRRSAVGDSLGLLSPGIIFTYLHS